MCIPDQIGTAHCKCNTGFNGTYCREQISCETFICQDGQYCLEQPDSIPQCTPVPMAVTTLPAMPTEETTIRADVYETDLPVDENDTIEDDVTAGENDTFDILQSESDSELPVNVIIILAVVGAILITAIVLGGLFLRTRRRATGTYRY